MHRTVLRISKLMKVTLVLSMHFCWHHCHFVISLLFHLYLSTRCSDFNSVFFILFQLLQATKLYYYLNFWVFIDAANCNIHGFGLPTPPAASALYYLAPKASNIRRISLYIILNQFMKPDVF